MTKAVLNLLVCSALYAQRPGNLELVDGSTVMLSRLWFSQEPGSDRIPGKVPRVAPPLHGYPMPSNREWLVPFEIDGFGVLVDISELRRLIVLSNRHDGTELHFSNSPVLRGRIASTQAGDSAGLAPEVVFTGVCTVAGDSEAHVHPLRYVRAIHRSGDQFSFTTSDRRPPCPLKSIQIRHSPTGDVIPATRLAIVAKGQLRHLDVSRIRSIEWSKDRRPEEAAEVLLTNGQRFLGTIQNIRSIRGITADGLAINLSIHSENHIIVRATFE
jgi:hypothetical protein